MSLAWADYEGVPRLQLFVTTSLGLSRLPKLRAAKVSKLDLLSISQHFRCIDRAVLLLQKLDPRDQAVLDFFNQMHRVPCWAFLPPCFRNADLDFDLIPLLSSLLGAYDAPHFGVRVKVGINS
jgi:hypothetical protein